MLGGEFGDLGGQEVGLVRDGVVVEHAGEWRRRDDGGDVVLHLAPVGGVDVGREDHQCLAACLLGLFREVDGVCRGEG